MYTVYYLNSDSEQVNYVCSSFEEVVELGKKNQITLVLDDAYNIITGEIARAINQEA